MSAELAGLLAQIQLSGAAAVLPAWLDRAASEELSYADFLQGLIEEELTVRTTTGIQRRLRDAGFPFAATIEQFDFRFRPELKRQVVLRYLDPTFVEQAGTLTLIGPPGLGKTMLAICVATKQVQMGASARFITAQSLAHQVTRAITSLGRQRLLKPLLTCDVLVLDELGYLPASSAFGPALYEIIASRYERRPTIITSNKSLTDWAQIVQARAQSSGSTGRPPHAPRAGLLLEGAVVAHQTPHPTTSDWQPPAAGCFPIVTRGGDLVTPSSDTISQKTVSGRPPVATKNLRVRPATGSPKQKGRRVATPRRSVDGTCEKPATDVARVARGTTHGPHARAPVRRHLAAPTYIKEPTVVSHLFKAALRDLKPVPTAQLPPKAAS